MAKEPTIKVDDLPEGEGAQELGEAELNGVVGGIKDGTSNTLMSAVVARQSLRARPKPGASDPDSGDEFV